MGSFFPDGEYFDEGEKQKAEFERTATKGMLANYAGAFGEFGMRNTFKYSLADEPAKPFQQASKLVQVFAAKDYADILHTTDRRLVVSAPVIKAIQRFEPDVH